MGFKVLGVKIGFNKLEMWRLGLQKRSNAFTDNMTWKGSKGSGGEEEIFVQPFLDAKGLEKQGATWASRFKQTWGEDSFNVFYAKKRTVMRFAQSAQNQFEGSKELGMKLGCKVLRRKIVFNKLRTKRTGMEINKTDFKLSGTWDEGRLNHLCYLGFRVCVFWIKNVKSYRFNNMDFLVIDRVNNWNYIYIYNIYVVWCYYIVELYFRRNKSW